MSDIRTFAPGYGTGVTISATTTSSNTAIRPGSLTLCITNRDATNDVYVRSTDGASDVATAADYVVMARQQVTITRNQHDAFIAVVAAAGTASVHVMLGDGI
jgi:phage tail sheath gpL-like